MKGCRCIIIALHLSACGTNKLLPHHFFKSAKALLSLFVDASMISETQYTVVSLNVIKLEFLNFASFGCRYTPYITSILFRGHGLFR